MYAQLLAACQQNFGPAPRKFSFWDRWNYLLIPRPDFVYGDPPDELETFFLNYPQLYQTGQVVWGHFVQANSLLYRPGKDDCPGEIVYSLAERNAPTPEDLGEIALRIARLKHTEPADPDLRKIADYLTNEWQRIYGWPVPGELCPGHECRLSTVYVVRKHLPRGGQHLCASYVPCVVSPTEPRVAMILPARFWPTELCEWWTACG